jgi:organic radical activating enzyme
MNLILTTLCNNNCSFCFAHETLDKKGVILSLEDIKEVVAFHRPEDNVKLLGGEPTLHPQFKEIMEFLKTVKNPVTLISNFIFNEEVKQSIIDFKASKPLDALINISETDGDRLIKVYENVKATEFYHFSIGFTITLEKHFEYYKSKLEMFKDFKEVQIRVSLPFPNPNQNNGFYLYKKYEYIDYIIEFIKWGIPYEINTSLDCCLYPCMIKDNKTEEFLSLHLKKFSFGCSGCPADVIKKDEIQYCYPGKNVKINTGKQISSEDSINKLIFSGREKLYLGNLPEECKNCCFLHKKCPGPCLGFIK